MYGGKSDGRCVGDVCLGCVRWLGGMVVREDEGGEDVADAGEVTWDATDDEGVYF